MTLAVTVEFAGRGSDSTLEIAVVGLHAATKKRVMSKPAVRGT